VRYRSNVIELSIKPSRHVVGIRNKTAGGGVMKTSELFAV